MAMRFILLTCVVLCVGSVNAQPVQEDAVVISDTIAKLFESSVKTLGGQSDSLSLIGLPTGTDRYRFVESAGVNQLLKSSWLAAKDSSNLLTAGVCTSPLPLNGKGGDRSKPLFLSVVQAEMHQVV